MLNVILSQKGFEATAKFNLETPKQAAELTARFIADQLSLQKKLKDVGMGINSGIRTSQPLALSISFDDGETVAFSISMSKYKIALSNEDNFALGCGMIAEHLQTWGMVSQGK